MSTITKPNREFLFDNIRGVLILLVVLGHALEYFRLENKVGEFLYVFIYLFHMPVFIFISGYFSKNLEKGRRTAVETFLVPYLLLNLFLSVIMLAIGKTQEILILSPGWTLWYLYCMFIWRLMLPDLVKIRYVLLLSFIVGIFSGFLTEFGTYMALARTLGFFPFFLAGYYANSQLIKNLRRIHHSKLISVGIIIFAIATAFFWISHDIPPELLWRDRAFNSFTIPLLQNLLTIIFLYGMGFAFVFVFITLANNKLYWFTPWGQRTLAIYLLHIYLVAPLVQGTEYIENPVLQLIILIGGSLLILYLLSRPKVTTTLQKTLARILHCIMPERKGDSS